MSAEPAIVEIEETTDTAPAADIAVATTGAAGSDVAAANDPSSEAYRSENAANEAVFIDDAPKPLADNTREEDLYNDGGKGAQTGDQLAQKQIKEQAVPGDWNIGGDGGGALHKESKADKQEKKSDEFWDRIQSLMDDAEERKRQEEHARKWDSEMHDIAGTRMSGHDFMKMSDYLKSEQGRKKVQEALQQQGMTKEQAEKATKKADEYNDLMKRIRNGEELTPEEELRRQELQRDRDVKTTVQTADRESKAGTSFDIKSTDQIKRDVVATSISSDVEVTQKIVKSLSEPGPHGNQNLEARGTFPRAPVLTDAFVKAGEAIDPLDNKTNALSPKVTVAIAKQEVAASGLSL